MSKLQSYGRRFVLLRNQLEQHLPADAVRLLLYIDRAASFLGIREWDVYPQTNWKRVSVYSRTARIDCSPISKGKGSSRSKNGRAKGSFV